MDSIAENQELIQNLQAAQILLDKEQVDALESLQSHEEHLAILREEEADLI